MEYENADDTQVEKNMEYENADDTQVEKTK
jgi:hypothetical protein